MEIVIKDLQHLRQAAGKLIDAFSDKRLFAFFGAMGSGKTTIIKSVCECLGATDLVSSPTFTLVNEYRTGSGQPLYHIDFYRIRKQEEVFDFGIEEYLNGESYCFMEWPELIEDILPDETVRIRITVMDNGARCLSVS